MTVLVAYASAHGSTREIAERIAARLRESDIDAEARSVDDVDDISRYSAFVVGSAIHSRAWLPEALRFVRENSGALNTKPIWLFSVGMPAALGRPFRRLAASESETVFAALRTLVQAREHRLFSGVVRRDQFPDLRSRLVFRAMGCRYGDFRDWQEIDAWGARIAAGLVAISHQRERHG